MHDLERDELIIHLTDPTDEEKRGVAAVDDLRVYFSPPAPAPGSASFQFPPIFTTTSQMEAKGRRVERDGSAPLYSKKLHIRVRRASTSCVTSFTIFAFAFGGIVVNHFARRTLPGFGFTSSHDEQGTWTREGEEGEGARRVLVESGRRAGRGGRGYCQYLAAIRAEYS